MDGHGSMWTVIRLKVDGPLDESKGRSGRSESVKGAGQKYFVEYSLMSFCSCEDMGMRYSLNSKGSRKKITLKTSSI